MHAIYLVVVLEAISPVLTRIFASWPDSKKKNFFFFAKSVRQSGVLRKQLQINAKPLKIYTTIKLGVRTTL